jgi:hypothetical protein
MYFFLSHDKRYILKTLKTAELPFFIKMLKDYYMHVRAWPHTLLPRFFGVYKVRGEEKKERREGEKRRREEKERTGGGELGEMNVRERERERGRKLKNPPCYDTCTDLPLFPPLSSLSLLSPPPFPLPPLPPPPPADQAAWPGTCPSSCHEQPI